MKKTILTLFILCFLSYPSLAADTDFSPELINVCNQVMLNIYNDILKAKDEYDELIEFSEDNLTKNSHGIYSIYYSYREKEGFVARYPYEFGVTITGIDDNDFQKRGRHVKNYVFPLINAKFAVFKKKSLRAKQFDVEEVMSKYGMILDDYQQKFMPFKLTLKTLKDEFMIGEPIEFEVTLTNDTLSNFRFKDLSNQTLFFLYNNQVWGAKPSDAGKERKRPANLVINGGESISRRFRGNAFNYPREFEIFCSYIMTYEGVQPTAKLKIKVVEEPSE